MTVALSLNIPDPTGAFLAYNAQVANAVQLAFTAWTEHLDASSGQVSLTVRYAVVNPGEAAAMSVSQLTSIASNLTTTAFAEEVGYGSTGSTATPTGTLTIGENWLANTFPTALNPNPMWLGDQVRVFEHELGHALGFWTYEGPNGTTTSSTLTTFDRYLSAGAASFNGPNAEADYGGPVTVDAASPPHLYVPGGVSVMSYLDQASSIQPLDIAVLKDTLLPVLTDQEAAEHAVIRLYQTALGRTPSTAELVPWTRMIEQGTPVSSVAQDFINSPEFAIHNPGVSSTTGFVDALYVNGLHRAADAAGEASYVGAINSGNLTRATVLNTIANSDEARADLSAQENISYAPTAEEEVARLYDTAFGRVADPAGFQGWTSALINGETVTQAAASFIASPEFAQRYGSSSPAALVAQLYENTLHRAPDPGGAAAWLGALSNGLSEASLVVGFSDSSEHIANEEIASRVSAGPYDTSGAGTTPILGLIPTHGPGSLIG